MKPRIKAPEQILFKWKNLVVTGARREPSHWEKPRSTTNEVRMKKGNKDGKIVDAYVVNPC